MGLPTRLMRVSKKKFWTGADVMKLRRLWARAPRAEVAAALPGRSWASITTQARRYNLFRQNVARNPHAVPAHPLLKLIRDRMTERCLTRRDIEVMAGLKRDTLRSWFTGRAEAKLVNIERALTALDGQLVIEWRS